MLGVGWGPCARAGTAPRQNEKAKQSQDRIEERLPFGCIVLHVPVRVRYVAASEGVPADSAVDGFTCVRNGRVSCSGLARRSAPLGRAGAHRGTGASAIDYKASVFEGRPLPWAPGQDKTEPSLQSRTDATRADRSPDNSRTARRGGRLAGRWAARGARASRCGDAAASRDERSCAGHQPGLADRARTRNHAGPCNC